MARGSALPFVPWLELGASSCALFALALFALAPTAHAQDSCMSDSDCAEGFACDLPPTAAIDCDPSSDCPADKIAPRAGSCEPAPLRCTTDSDCPKGLSCDLHDDSDCASTAPPSAGAGGAGAEVPPDQAQCDDQPSDGQCVFTLTECTKDSQCDGDTVCTELGRTEECSGGAPACEPGQQCAQPEQQCTEIANSYCFPPRMDCGAGQKCAAGTRCVELSEDARKDSPPGWEGLSALCLPESWALVLEGRVDVEGGSSSESASDSVAGGDSKGSGQPQSGSAAGSGARDDSAAASDDSGCAVRAPGTRTGGVTLVALGAALLGLLRRRRSQRSLARR